MSKLLTTNKNRPCPVCAKTNGNCRILPDDGVFCMTFPDGENHPDYRYVKATVNGQWGMYFPRKADDFDRQAWEQRKAEREARELEIERQRREKCLTPDQRDTEYRRLFAELALTNGDRQNLLKRGFTEAEIEQGGYVTAGKYQRLQGKYHVNLPGISKYGNCLTNRLPGFIVPVKNAHGQIVAYQVRDSESYKWAKGAKLANGEQPMGVAFPAIANGLTNVIGTGEGFLKTQRASHRLGIPFLGAAGGNFTPKETKEALEELTKGIDNPLIADYPDAGWKSNPHVARQTYRRVKLMESLGYTVMVANWGQGYDKAVGDIDEITPEQIATIRLISPKEAFAGIPGLQSVSEKFADWVESQAKRFKPKGFGALKIEGEKFTGDRSTTWQQAIERGQSILDNSLMGSGKSYAVPEVTNPHGGKIWYVYGDHRNPTIEAIAQDFTDLYPRNQHGFYTDGNGKIKPATDPEIIPTIKPNCVRADLFPQLTELGHDPNDGGGGNPICQSCPMANVCAHAPGWYRADRRSILNNAHKIRCHIDSMPRDWNYSKDIIILDEPSQQLEPTKTIETNWDGLLREADRVRESLTPELWTELDNFLQPIKPLFGNTPRYGLPHAEIMAKLPSPSPALATAIAANTLDLSAIFVKAERERWAAGIKALNQENHYQAINQTKANLAQIPPNALAHLVAGNGILRLTNQTLTITIDRRGEYGFLNRAASIIALDATITGDRLKTLAGLTREVRTINNTPARPLSNQTVHQIKVQGIGSKSISTAAVNRLAALCRELGDMPTIGLKSWANLLDLDGYWWRDSRGVNDYAGEARILALGLPCPNVGAIEDSYLAIGGHPDQFPEYYAGLVNEEILQMTGRQRANRYPDRQFEIFLITPEHTDLSWLTEYGVRLSTKTGFEITPAAGNQNQFTRWQILTAIMEGNTTQTAIAKALGITQQAISKQLQSAGVTVQFLANKLAKFLPEISTTGPYKAPIRGSCTLGQILKDFAFFFDLDIADLVEDIAQTIKTKGWPGLLHWLDCLPEPLQLRYHSLLWSWLDIGPSSPAIAILGHCPLP